VDEEDHVVGPLPHQLCMPSRAGPGSSSSTCRLTCPAAGARNAARNPELVTEENWFCGPGTLTCSFANDLRADLLVDAYCHRLAPAHAGCVTEQRRNGSQHHAGVGCERRLTDLVPPLSVQLALTAQPDAQDSGLVVKCGALGAEVGLCAGELAA
jgi:hypothetical protein